MVRYTLDLRELYVHVLTVVVYGTQYPEAVVLRKNHTETFAAALVGIFNRVKVLKEIISDYGTQFTSDMMKEVASLLSLEQLTTNTYPAICNDLEKKSSNAPLKHAKEVM